MDSQTYQLIINAFSVGTWLQTLLFYSLLVFLLNVILMQSKMSPNKLGVELIVNEEEEPA